MQKANLSRRARKPSPVGRGEEWATTRRCDLMGPRGYTAGQYYSNRIFGGRRARRIFGGWNCSRDGARSGESAFVRKAGRRALASGRCGVGRGKQGGICK